jgi:hypothetical protein
MMVVLSVDEAMLRLDKQVDTFKKLNEDDLLAIIGANEYGEDVTGLLGIRSQEAFAPVDYFKRLIDKGNKWYEKNRPTIQKVVCPMKKYVEKWTNDDIKNAIIAIAALLGFTVGSIPAIVVAGVLFAIKFALDKICVGWEPATKFQFA